MLHEYNTCEQNHSAACNLEHITRIIEFLENRDKELVNVRFIEGLLYFKKEDYILAETIFSEIVKQWPEYRMASYYLALILQQNNEVDRALTVL